MTSRSQRKLIAEETVAILREGTYRTAGGVSVDLRPSLRAACDGSLHLTADTFPAIPKLVRRETATLFEVQNETTLAAARRLVAAGHPRVLVLNFASAKNPGGGFLGGSEAQEESLARASGLYSCLMRFPEFYESHRRGESCLYDDQMIYSPKVPVFRDDDDHLLDAPCEVSILTAPAVNAGAVRKNEPRAVSKIEPAMRERVEKVLRAGAAFNYPVLVLGAWGCGVFKNSPIEVARWFAESLRGDYHNVFERVAFAVFDRRGTGESIAPFQARFANR